MTGKERIARQLKRLPVDQIGAAESFWSFTAKRWVDAGDMPPDVSCVDHFNLNIETCWALRLAIDPVFESIVIAEDADTQTFLDGNGAKLRRHRHHASTPEHVGYAIADRVDWEEKAKPFLTPTDNRLNLASYSKMRAQCERKSRFFCYGGVNVFEAIHPICGHENMLIGMALDPGWIMDMASTYADLMIALFEKLFAKAGKPDGLWFFDDMGFKARPFMSPAMYRELIMPAHKKTIDFAHAAGLPVIMHSCGFVEPLLPDMVAAGIDALQAIEIKAGMDLLRIYERFGDRIALIGGLDVRPIAANDLAGIQHELEAKIPIVKQRNGFILHSDHSIPESTDYATYQYFLDLGRRLGTY